MLNCHYFFRNSLCLILIFSLILLPAGCGEKSENTDFSISIDISNEADSSLVSNAADTALPQGTEPPEETEVIEDKFVMLREVYDILSGSLGEPYRTPEYWGGEEIDMMEVGDGYLIGLRNVKNQMHYLLYKKKQTPSSRSIHRGNISLGMKFTTMSISRNFLFPTIFQTSIPEMLEKERSPIPLLTIPISIRNPTVSLLPVRKTFLKFQALF